MGTAVVLAFVIGAAAVLADLEWKLARSNTAGILAGVGDMAVAVLVVATTSTVSLVMEDLLPARGQPSRGPTPLRVGAVLMCLVLLWWSVSLRRRLSLGFGTFYYAQMLTVEMTDRHARQVENLSRNYADVRIFDEPLGALDKPCDIWSPVKALADEVSNSMQHDTRNTGYHLAPNLLWPAALAFGSSFTYLGSLQLIELDPARTEKALLQPNRLTWSWRDRTDGDYPVTVCPPDNPSVAGHTLVVIDMTDADPTTVPQSWAPAKRYDVNAVDKRGTRPAKVRVEVNVTPSVEEEEVVAAPWAIVRQAAAAIGLAVHHCREGEWVFVMGRMPKTVAVSLGRRLVALDRPLCNVNGCQRAQCRNPWSVLVPLNSFQRKDRSFGYVPLRVHPAQPLEVLKSLTLLEPGNQPQAPGQVRIVNLTAHRVDLLDGSTVRASFPPSGAVARLTEILVEQTPWESDKGPLPTTRIRYGEPIDVPDPTPGTAFLVSRVLAAAVPRADLCFPAEEVRDPSGQIIGCRSLGTFDGSPGRGPREATNA